MFGCVPLAKSHWLSLIGSSVMEILKNWPEIFYWQLRSRKVGLPMSCNFQSQPCIEKPVVKQFWVVPAFHWPGPKHRYGRYNYCMLFLLLGID